MGRVISPSKQDELTRVVAWYVDRIYGTIEGPGTTPFYCDPEKVGLAAVDPRALAQADEAALFKLFLSLAMYQARRDVVIQAQQRGWNRTEATSLLSLSGLQRRMRSCPCPHLANPGRFEQACTVIKVGKTITCDYSALACPVRDAARVWGRMADLGKLPTSAYWRIWAKGGTTNLIQQASRESDPTLRLESVIAEFAQVFRVGRKLATLFVSAVSTPALAPGLTPWWPNLDGNLAVVLDTHATRAVVHLAGKAAGSTYQSRVDWLRRVSENLDLTRFHCVFPSFSPRLVQQALYAFCSKSNRLAWDRLCPHEEAGQCHSGLCPFHKPM